MDDFEEEMRLRQIVKGSAIKSGIRYLVTILLFLASAVSLFPSPITALILAECAHIIYRGLYYILFVGAKTSLKIKGFISSVIPGAIAILVVGFAGIIFESDSAKNIIIIITKIVTGVWLVPLVIPILKGYMFDDKFDDTDVISSRNLSSKLKLLYRLLTIFSRIFVILGLALTIFAKPYYNLYYEGVTIAGCILWIGRQVLICYCWVNCDIVRDSDGQSGEVYREDVETRQAGGSGSNKTLNDHEVKKIVEKIANRWTGRGDTFFMVEGVSIKYSVTSEVSGGSFINFTVNGRLSGVRDGNRGEALTYGRSKLDDVAQKIKMDAVSELEKENLPHPYDINVSIGYIE